MKQKTLREDALGHISFNKTGWENHPSGVF